MTVVCRAESGDVQYLGDLRPCETSLPNRAAVQVEASCVLLSQGHLGN